jgi:hypothetical protein
MSTPRGCWPAPASTGRPVPGNETLVRSSPTGARPPAGPAGRGLRVGRPGGAPPARPARPEEPFRPPGPWNGSALLGDRRREAPPLCLYPNPGCFTLSRGSVGRGGGGPDRQRIERWRLSVGDHERDGVRLPIPAPLQDGSAEVCLGRAPRYGSARPSTASRCSPYGVHVQGAWPCAGRSRWRTPLRVRRSAGCAWQRACCEGCAGRRRTRYGVRAGAAAGRASCRRRARPGRAPARRAGGG